MSVVQASFCIYSKYAFLAYMEQTSYSDDKVLKDTMSLTCDLVYEVTVILSVRFVSHLTHCWTNWMNFQCVWGRILHMSTWSVCSRPTLVSTCWSWSSNQRPSKSVTGNDWCASCVSRGCCRTWRSDISGTSTSSRTRWLSKMCCSLHREKWLSRSSSNKYELWLIYISIFFSFFSVCECVCSVAWN